MRDWSKVKEICDKATPGSWDGRLNPIDSCWEETHPEDGDFIATARTALPEAIAEIEQLRELLGICTLFIPSGFPHTDKLRKQIFDALGGELTPEVVEEIRTSFERWRSY